MRERLAFLHKCQKYGQIILCESKASIIWNSLVNEGLFQSDVEVCLKWFTDVLMHPSGNRFVFHQLVLKLDPRKVNHTALACFERFFRAVEYTEGDSVRDLTNPLPALEFLWEVSNKNTEESVALRY